MREGAAQPLTGSNPAASGGVDVARRKTEKAVAASRWTAVPSSRTTTEMPSGSSKVALVVMLLSALCCDVSSQGHVQETIGQTLQGERRVVTRVSSPQTALGARAISVPSFYLFGIHAESLFFEVPASGETSRVFFFRLFWIAARLRR